MVSGPANMAGWRVSWDLANGQAVVQGAGATVAQHGSSFAATNAYSNAQGTAPGATNFIVSFAGLPVSSVALTCRILTVSVPRPTGCAVLWNFSGPAGNGNWSYTVFVLNWDPNNINWSVSWTVPGGESLVTFGQVGNVLHDVAQAGAALTATGALVAATGPGAAEGAGWNVTFSGPVVDDPTFKCTATEA
jgi:hypothetical protein